MQVLPADHPRQCALLADSPIGPLGVIEWDGEFFVAKIDPHDPTRIRSIIHTLRDKQNPLDAIYGKRVLEGKAVQALYTKQDEVKEKSAASFSADVSKDMRKGAWRIWNREGGRDAFATLMKRKRGEE